MKRVFTPKQFKELVLTGNPGTDICLRKFYTKTATDLGDRRLKFCISDQKIDRSGDIVSLAGWDLANWKANPAVQWCHKYDELGIAKGIAIGIEGDELCAIAEFPTEDVYDFADRVYKMYLGGYHRATSVGMNPKRYGWRESTEDQPSGMDFFEQELLEFSLCPIPDNPRALSKAIHDGIDLGPMKAWALKQIDLNAQIWMPKSELVLLAKACDPAQSESVSLAGIEVFDIEPDEEVIKGAHPSHKTDTVDVPWNEAEVMHRVKENQPESYYKKLAAYRNPGVQGDCKSGHAFYHHDANEDGAPMAANVRACRACIKALKAGVRPGSEEPHGVPEGDMEKVHKHLAGHITDHGETPEPFKAIESPDNTAWFVASISMKRLLEGKPEHKNETFDSVSVRFSELGKTAPDKRFVDAAVLANLPDMFHYDVVTGELKHLTRDMRLKMTIAAAITDAVEALDRESVSNAVGEYAGEESKRIKAALAILKGETTEVILTAEDAEIEIEDAQSSLDGADDGVDIEDVDLKDIPKLIGAATKAALDEICGRLPR